MVDQTTRYGLGTTVRLPYAQAIERVREELAREGFGVLSEIDIAATLKKKLDVDFRPYVILGACNPPLAHRALTAEPQIGLLLPCNVIVYTGEREDESIVAAMDPRAALSLSDNPQIEEVAEDVRNRLERVLQKVSDAADSASRG
jgi:uncharacterized protein (DUF302 family)